MQPSVYICRAEGSVPGNSIEVSLLTYSMKLYLSNIHQRTSFLQEQDPGSWVETFTTLQTTFTDNKPHGPEAIALDFGFPEAKVLFGELLDVNKRNPEDL